MNGAYEKHEPILLQGWHGKGFRGYPPSFHNHAELVYVHEGCISVIVDGQPYELQAGQLLLLFPYLTHSYQEAPDATVTLLLFDPGSIAFTNTFLSNHPVCPVAEGQEFDHMLSRAVTMLRGGRIKTATGYLNAVIGELLEVMSLVPRPDISDNTVVQILEYCSEHFTEPLTLESVADALYISQSYVSKVFAQKLRYRFREYINSLRVEKAKELLADSSLPISEIMDACGFSNQSSFNRVFRESCGLSPRQYREHLTR